MITLDEIQASLHSIKVSDGTNELSIDGSGYLTVNVNGDITATDLDIRDLTSASDSVEIKTAAGQALDIDGSGYITSNINGTVTVSATALDIRALTNADVVTVEDGGGSLTVDGTVAATQSGSWTIETTPGGYATWKVTNETVSNTESELASTPLAGRLSVTIQNLGAQDIYIKEATGVTTANGLKLPKGSSFAQNLDDSSNIFAITGSGTSDVRIAEYAA